MTDALKAVLSTIQQFSPGTLLGICIASGTTLFSSDKFITIIGLENIRNEYKSHFGIAFLLSTSILLSYAIFGLTKKVYNKYIEYRGRREAENVIYKHLKELTAEEKGYLVPYVLDGKNTQTFVMDDGVAGGLVAKGIIYRSSNAGDLIKGFPYNIQPIAKDYLFENKHFLEGAGPRPKPYSHYDW